MLFVLSFLLSLFIIFFIMATLNVSTLFVSPPPPRRVLSTNHNQAAASLTVCRLIRKSSDDLYVPGLNVLMGSGLRGRVCFHGLKIALFVHVYLCLCSICSYVLLYVFVFVLVFCFVFYLKDTTNQHIFTTYYSICGRMDIQTNRQTDWHAYMRQRHFQSTYIRHVSISVRFQVTTTRTLRDIHVSINKMKTFSRTLGSIYHNCLF